MLSFEYYSCRNHITFCETLLCPENAQMQLCHLCAVCAQTAEGAFYDLRQTSADNLRRGTAEIESNFHVNESNALCAVWIHKGHK